VAFGRSFFLALAKQKLEPGILTVTVFGSSARSSDFFDSDLGVYFRQTDRTMVSYTKRPEIYPHYASSSSPLIEHRPTRTAASLTRVPWLPSSPQRLTSPRRWLTRARSWWRSMVRRLVLNGRAGHLLLAPAGLPARGAPGQGYDCLGPAVQPRGHTCRSPYL
jgi:hypothetical protein